MKIIDHPLDDQASGMDSLDYQRRRDNANWFEGFGDGIIWGLIIGFIICAVIAVFSL